MTWANLLAGDPHLASLGESMLERTGLALVGTLRGDGWPRISPVEPLIADGRLYLGMMWQSRKALDLLRDPRVTLHSTVSDKSGGEGEFKVFGMAIEVTDAPSRERFCDALRAKIGWAPDEPDYHLFHVEIESAAYARVVNGEWQRRLWRD